MGTPGDSVTGLVLGVLPVNGVVDGTAGVVFTKWYSKTHRYNENEEKFSWITQNMRKL